MNRSRGFSLVELLITVAIIGILSLMAYPLYGNYVVRVRLAKLVAVIDYNLARPLTEAYATGTADALLSEEECDARFEVVYNEIAEFQKSYGQPLSPVDYGSLTCPSEMNFSDGEGGVYYHTTSVARLYFDSWKYTHPEDVYIPGGTWWLELVVSAGEQDINSSDLIIYNDKKVLNDQSGDLTWEDDAKPPRKLPAGGVMCAMNMYAGQYFLPVTNTSVIPKQCKQIYLNRNLMYAEF